jgi:hypothetical protein
MRFPLVVTVVAVLAVLAGTQASARSSCTAGVRSAGGVTYRTFCGSARAVVHLGRRTYVFTGGSCDRGAFTINIGTITLPPGRPKYRYFGITVFTNRDGTFKDQAVTWQLPNGRRNSLFHATVVLAGGRSHGTFSGSTLAGNVRGSGSFHC